MKCGLKTFPMPVDLDDSVKLIEAEFGIKGYAVVIKLYQAIYSRGYYMKWDIDTKLLFIRDYCLSEVGRNCVSEIVACCLRRGVFESSLYEKYKILTSKRIQETFLIATKRNKQVVFEKEYALPIVYTFIESASKNEKDVNIIFKNADISQQKKEKEKKGKESNNNTGARTREDDCKIDLEELQGSDECEKQEDVSAFSRFIKKWEIQTRALDNYSGGKIAGIDWDAVSAWVEKSSYLQQQKAVTFYIDHAKEILDGKYFDYKPPKARSQKELTTQSKEEDSCMEEGIDVERLSRIGPSGGFWDSPYANAKRKELEQYKRLAKSKPAGS